MAKENAEQKVYSYDDMKNAFIAGGIFEKNTIDFDMNEVEEVTEPDFGVWLDDYNEINNK